MDNLGNLRRQRSRDTREREQVPVIVAQEESRSRQPQQLVIQPLPLGIAGRQSRLAQEKRQSLPDNHQGVRTTQGNLTRDEVMQMFGDLKDQLVTMIQQTQAESAAPRASKKKPRPAKRDQQEGSRRTRDRQSTPHPVVQQKNHQDIDFATVDWAKVRVPETVVPRKMIRHLNSDGSQFVFNDARQYLSHKKNTDSPPQSDTASTPSMPDDTYQNYSLRCKHSGRRGMGQDDHNYAQKRREIRKGKKTMMDNKKNNPP